MVDKIRTPRKPRGPVNVARLFQTFKRILELNNRILERIADMGDKLGGDYVFDGQYIRSSSRQVGALVGELIYNFNLLAPRRYPSLDTVFHGIRHDIEEELAGRVVIPQTEFAVPYDSVTGDFDDVVGGKNIHIAEIRNRLGVAVPEGFAVTTRAYRAFLDHNRLPARLTEILSAWQDNRLSLAAASRALMALFDGATVPPRLVRAIKTNLKRLQQATGDRRLLLAVRSSAMGEDGEHSFAGQFSSFLNRTPQALLSCYREVIASAYSPSAMEYRRQKGIAEEEVAMAVACQEMIDAAVSGVLYTLDPVAPLHETMTVSAAWGLGAPIVDGTITADRFSVSREFPHPVQAADIVCKDRQWVPAADGGCEFRPVDAADQMRPSLSDTQLKSLAETALVIERYFKCPQDIEWAFDRSGRLVVLQARSLNVRPHMAPALCDIASVGDRHPVIFSGQGVIVQSGIASGKVYVVQRDSDLDRFPNGSILVARKTSPRFAKVARKAVAIITDIGSSTGHMAAIAREFRIPTVVNTEVATRLLEPGREITLDAQENIVYAGRIRELCYYGFMEEAFEETYEYRLLRRILKKITPLNLVDPHARDFAPQACRSLHDITRFIHEKAVEALADLNYRHHWHNAAAGRKLVLDIPLDLVMIDIHDGLAETDEKTPVTRQQVRSAPMQAFLDGLCAPGVWSREPMSVDFSSFMSSLTRTFSAHTVNPQQVGRNLAVISRHYANINLRLGYHFNMIDAYISEHVNDNYAYFRFIGGVTDPQRRSRRARLIYDTLAQHDFSVDLRGDMVIGRIKKLDAASMADKMVLLGQLVGFTRQLDVKMTSDAQVGTFAREFEQLLKMDQPIHE